MLVLSQKKGESFKIGADVTISILEIKAGRVRLGIAAPNSAAIVRLDEAGNPKQMSAAAASLHAKD